MLFVCRCLRLYWSQSDTWYISRPLRDSVSDCAFGFCNTPTKLRHHKGQRCIFITHVQLYKPKFYCFPTCAMSLSPASQLGNQHKSRVAIITASTLAQLAKARHKNALVSSVHFIQHSLFNTQDAALHDASKRGALQQQSAERAAQWTNTIRVCF